MLPDPAHVASGVSAQCGAPDDGLPGSAAEPPVPAHEASGFGTHAVPPESAYSTSGVSAQRLRNQPT
eukprot:39336-Alexandrium_andersonii.AAC.1